jgi:hypothetical protein
MSDSPAKRARTENGHLRALGLVLHWMVDCSPDRLKSRRQALAYGDAARSVLGLSSACRLPDVHCAVALAWANRAHALVEDFEIEWFCERRQFWEEMRLNGYGLV